MKVSFLRDASVSSLPGSSLQATRHERNVEYLPAPRPLPGKPDPAEPFSKMAVEVGAQAAAFEPMKLTSLLEEVHREELDKSTPLVTNADDNFLHRQTFEVFDDRYVDWTSLRIESIVAEYLKESESG